MHNNQHLPVMAHLVLGYPTLSQSVETAEQYIRAGVRILELQIPFSHPTADGPVITAACQQAVANGTSVQDCIDAILSLRSKYPNQEIVPMSYLNRIYTFGLTAFCAALRTANIEHLIVPDLPVDSIQAAQIKQNGIKLVPVLAANVSESRLKSLETQQFDLYYLMSDFKITGSGFSLHPRLKAVIEAIRRAPNPVRIGIGFGISTPEQIQYVVQEVDFAIVGSSLIQAQDQGRLSAYLDNMKGIVCKK